MFLHLNIHISTGFVLGKFFYTVLSLKFLYFQRPIFVRLTLKVRFHSNKQTNMQQERMLIQMSYIKQQLEKYTGSLISIINCNIVQFSENRIECLQHTQDAD